MGEKNEAACAYLVQKNIFLDFMRVFLKNAHENEWGKGYEQCERGAYPKEWQRQLKGRREVVLRDEAGCMYGILDVEGLNDYSVVIGVLPPGEKSWLEEKVFLEDLAEHDFYTGLKEVIQFVKCRNDKRAMKTFLSEDQQRLEKLDEETFYVICVLTGNKKLLRSKTKYENEKGEYDMYKALSEIMKENEISGEKHGKECGVKLGEKKGIHRVNELNKKLFSDKRLDDLKKATYNAGYQRQLLAEYKL